MLSRSSQQLTFFSSSTLQLQQRFFKLTQQQQHFIRRLASTTASTSSQPAKQQEPKQTASISNRLKSHVDSVKHEMIFNTNNTTMKQGEQKVEERLKKIGKPVTAIIANKLHNTIDKVKAVSQSFKQKSQHIIKPNEVATQYIPQQQQQHVNFVEVGGGTNLGLDTCERQQWVSSIAEQNASAVEEYVKLNGTELEWQSFQLAKHKEGEASATGEKMKIKA